MRQLSSTYVIHHYDPSTRSFLDVEGEMSSRFFAMVCHSCIYQPTLKNKLLCALQMGRETVLHGRVAGSALVAAIKQYRREPQLRDYRRTFPREA